MSLFDKIMDKNMDRMKYMQKKMLDVQEEIYKENGEQIKRINTKSAELTAPGTKTHYEAVAGGIKEGLASESNKFCSECGNKISKTAKFCSECGAKQN